ncbi:MAG: hypothetical protein KKC20_00380 [Proteobacteria bacterium]|nr:hypothetical protein [Pseudomonadota bacterium]
MQFIVTGYDGRDDNALERRMAAREAHLAMAKKMVELRHWISAAAILDDGGKMTGSLIICEFESRQDLESRWLEKEPYVLGKVWEKIEITRAQVPPLWDKK